MSKKLKLKKVQIVLIAFDLLNSYWEDKDEPHGELHFKEAMGQLTSLILRWQIEAKKPLSPIEQLVDKAVGR